MRADGRRRKGRALASEAGHEAVTIAGVRIDVVDLDAAVNALLGSGRPRRVYLCNAYTISLAARDDTYRRTINAGDLNLPDGMPLVWIARRRGAHALRGRVYGPDLMAATLDRGRAFGLRHYLYGSTPQVLEALCARIATRWPGAQVVGAESPPFAPITDAELDDAAARMDEVGADVVWVGLGTPKQDEVVHRLAERTTAANVAVGAAFDFLSGTKPQAPVWMREHGLEWCFRLATEPRRLWRRYLIGNARFVWAVARDGRKGSRA